MVGINTSMSGLPVEWEKRIKKHSPYTFIVDKNGRGTHSTIQDAFDAAYAVQRATANDFTVPKGIWIRGGEYREQTDLYAFGTLVQGDGVGAKILGDDEDGQLLRVTGAYNTFRDLWFYNTPGGGKTINCLYDLTQGGNYYSNVRIYGSDGYGWNLNVGNQIDNCMGSTCDADGFNCYSDGCKFTACNFGSNGAWGMNLGNNADNSTISGCYGYSNTSGDCVIQLHAENCVVVGNRFSSTTTVSDLSGTSTVASNNLS